MAAIPPRLPLKNPIARWFHVGGAIFSGIGCLTLMGAAIVIVGANAFMPSDKPPSGYDAGGRDAYTVVTAPFRGFRWLIDQISPVLVIIGVGPLLLGVLLLFLSRGVAHYRRWARVAGAVLLLVPVVFGAMAIMGAIVDRDYDVAAYPLPLVLFPLYPLWLLVWKWDASSPGKSL